MRIYIGNMNFKTSETQLRALFESFGQVDEVAVVNDRETGRPRGIAFVVMHQDDKAKAAIEALNNTEFEGRILTVNEAKPRATARPQTSTPIASAPEPKEEVVIRPGGYANHRLNAAE